MRGRKPKPTNLKVLQGNPGKRKLPENEPQPVAASIDPPIGLSDSALECWHIVAKQLVEARLLTVLDTHALVLYCEAYALWKRAKDDLTKEKSLTVETELTIKSNPLIAVMNTAFGQMMKITTEFGMTPSSRSKVKVTPEGDLDPLEQMLKRSIG